MIREADHIRRLADSMESLCDRGVSGVCGWCGGVCGVCGGHTALSLSLSRCHDLFCVYVVADILFSLLGVLAALLTV